MTQSDETIIKALKNIADYQEQQDSLNAASIVGIHLEGPFISEYKVGAQIQRTFNVLQLKRYNNFKKFANNQIKY